MDKFTPISELLEMSERDDYDDMKHDFSRHDIVWYYCQPCNRVWHGNDSSSNSDSLFCRDRSDIGQAQFNKAIPKICPLANKGCLLHTLNITTPEPIQISHHRSPRNIKTIRREYRRVYGKDIQIETVPQIRLRKKRKSLDNIRRKQ
jgi:hypothetical protein